jgi:hypothetical protein
LPKAIFKVAYTRKLAAVRLSSTYVHVIAEAIVSTGGKSHTYVHTCWQRENCGVNSGRQVASKVCVAVVALLVGIYDGITAFGLLAVRSADATFLDACFHGLICVEPLARIARLARINLSDVVATRPNLPESIVNGRQKQ